MKHKFQVGDLIQFPDKKRSRIYNKQLGIITKIDYDQNEYCYKIFNKDTLLKDYAHNGFIEESNTGTHSTNLGPAPELIKVLYGYRN